MLGIVTGPMFRLLVKKSKRDISNPNFYSRITIARVLRKAKILLCFRNRIDQINFYDFYSWTVVFISDFLEASVNEYPLFLVYLPIIKCTQMNTILFAPLVIGKFTLAAFHDKFYLIVFTNSFIHNDGAPFRNRVKC